MKRILAMLLALIMGVSLFAGCVNKTPTSTTEPTVVVEATPDLQLEKAIEYLRVFYKEGAEKTPTDYNRLGTVRIGVTAYDVEWSVDVSEDVLKIVKNADGSYTIDINEEAFKETTEPTPYVLTATITGKDGRKLTISWEYNIPAAIDEESIEAIKKAYALAPGETMEGTYTVIGVITSINTPYDSGYKNITVTIEVAGAEDMPLVCYRLKGDGADKLAVGDTVTVTGNFMNYNGQVQFAQGCILEAVESGGGEAPVAPENPVDILKAAYALAPGSSLPYSCTLSGTITFVDQAYSADYGNITVTMNSHGYSIKCYRLKGDGVDQLNVNDEITVSGVITNYNGTIEFGSGCLLISRVDHEPPAKIPDPTPGTNLTVSQAYTIGRGKDHDTYTEGSYYITGTIVSIENDYYGNMHISDGSSKLMIYGSYSEDGKTRYGDLPSKPGVGDTVTVYGKIGRYGSNPQMKNAWLIGVKGNTPEIPDAPTVEQVTSLVPGTAYRFGMAQGNLENAVYYLAGGMNGYYMATTADPADAINVYVEEAAGGYYFYTLSGEEKLYINMVVSADGAHVNGAYEAAASTVYTYNAASNTLIATVDGAEYWFGTRNDKTYTTMGPCKVELEGFFGQFYVGSEGQPETPDEPDVPQISELVADKAYKFGMIQGNLNNKVFYLAGGMDGYYMATSDDVTAAIDVYVEETEGGYYFYTLDGETKLYINMVVNGTHVNGAYEATASTVYTYNAEKNTLIAVVNDAEYWFSTRNDNTYTTMGPNKVSYDGFFGQFYDPNAEEPEDPTPDEPVVPDEPDVPVIDELVADKAYKFGMAQGNLNNKVFYLIGGMDGYYMATSDDVTAAIDVYVEETEGGYYFYTLDGETKLYINMVVNGTHVNGAYEATASTVYTYNAEKNTLIAVVNDAEYWFSTRNDNTYTTMGPNKVSYNGFFGQFYDPNAEEPDQPDTPVVPDEPDVPDEPTYVTSITAGTAYKLGLYSTSKSATYYFIGTMSGYYGATETAYESGVDVFVEETTDGYYLYFLDAAGAKQYINLVASGNYKNFTFDAAASSVYTWDAEKNALKTTVDTEVCYIGTYGSYVTMGVLQTSKLQDTDYIARLYTAEGSSDPEQPTCEHANTTIQGAKDKTCTEHGHTGMVVCSDCGEVIDEGSWIPALGHSYVDGICSVCGEADPNYNPDQPDQPDQPTTGLQEGVAYTISADNATGTLWFNGTVSSGRFNGSYEESEAVHVYIENVDGGFLLYFLDGEAKQYICMDDKSAGGSFSTDAASATVFEWNAEKATAAVAEDTNNRAFGCDATKDYTNFSCYDLSNDYNWGKFTPVDGGNTEPDQPTCQHANTTVEGAKEATCTENGHTGKTVCSDCGTVLNAGSVIAAPGHSYVDGTCGVCGEADPSTTPDQPDQPTAGLQEGVAYTISADNATGTLWFNGTVSNGRFNGSYEESEAVHVYIENVDGGFLLYFMDGNTKQYICMGDSSTGGSFGTDAASATVFEWNAEKATAAVAEDSNNRAFGCDAAKTYTNFSCYDLSGNYNWGQFTPVDGGSTEPDLPEPCSHEHTTVKDAADATCTVDGHTGRTVCADCGYVLNAGSVIAAPGHSYVDGICGVCGEADPGVTPDEPADPTTELVVGAAYKFGMIQGNVSTTDVYYLAGGMDSYYMATTTDAASAIDVYVEETEGGYYFYTLDGESKLYINMVISGTHVNGAYEAAASTVYTYDAENNTLIAIVNDAEYWFATRNDNTYTTLGPAKVSYEGFFGQFYATSDEDPEACQHANTTVEGAKEATCTENGHTGKTVCSDCGEVLIEGEIIAAPGHSYVDGACTVCGEEEPSVEIVTATISFATTEPRTSLSATEQVWAQNGITVTNQKAASSFDVADFSNPVRFYKNSSLEIAYPGMTQIEFACNTSNTSYVTALVNSITDATVTADGSVVTVTFSEPQDSFSIAALSGQVRMNSITVTAVAAEELEHVIENGGGYAAVLSADGAQLDCYQLSDENAIFYTNYFTEKPAEGYYEIREYNGNFYYTSAPSWGVIGFESITISGQTAQLKLYGDEGVIELELTAKNQYTVTTGIDSMPAGVVFTFGSDSCTVMGHLGSVKCEEDITCFYCEEVICAGPGHEFGDDDICYRCYEATRPEAPAAGLQEGVAYTISADNATGTLWFNGTVSNGRFNGSYNESEAVSVYVEYVPNGFLLYFLDGNTKQYICMGDSSTGGSFSTDAASATVFEWNAEKATAAVAEDSNNRAFGCDSTKTYTNFSCYDLSGNYNWGKFTAI